ncbi:hypothetical protein LAZ67_18002366 [Cordylochernes scorpioides]|uniref:GIY-YIG domain-containing protein n=1 Tax=Cordylochernes scorpioides TaxID=51811 RepID=A0ABY6LGI7_9ARAC|nr:hypothetical protein LAZ67_18002366 [Cordylochernes scorpioides]
MDIKNVRKWCREFNEGRINVHDEQRSGRPSLPESTMARIDEIHFSVHKIVSETLGYRKVSASPHEISDDCEEDVSTNHVASSTAAAARKLCRPRRKEGNAPFERITKPEGFWRLRGYSVTWGWPSMKGLSRGRILVYNNTISCLQCEATLWQRRGKPEHESARLLCDVGVAEHGRSVKRKDPRVQQHNIMSAVRGYSVTWGWPSMEVRGYSVTWGWPSMEGLSRGRIPGYNNTISCLQCEATLWQRRGKPEHGRSVKRKDPRVQQHNIVSAVRGYFVAETWEARAWKCEATLWQRRGKPEHERFVKRKDPRVQHRLNVAQPITKKYRTSTSAWCWKLTKKLHVINRCADNMTGSWLNTPRQPSIFLGVVDRFGDKTTPDLANPESRLETSDYGPRRSKMTKRNLHDQPEMPMRGSPMGSPLSTIAAEIVMSNLDRWLVSHNHLGIEMWSRYVDDIFCLHRDTDHLPILTVLNSYHHDLRFTHNPSCFNCIPFLDVLVINTNGTFQTTVYRKPNFTPSYLHFLSHAPVSHKITTVKTLSKRVYTHCSLALFRTIEKRTVYTHLLSAGYPHNFIDRHFYVPNHKKVTPPLYKNVCVLPFSTTNSDIALFLRKFGIRTFFKNSPSIEASLRHPITKSSIKLNPLSLNNGIYKISCNDCEQCYIGETGRTIATRIREHNRNIRSKDRKSLIFQHMADFDHSFNLDDTISVYRDIGNKYQRLVLEALVSNCTPRGEHPRVQWPTTQWENIPVYSGRPPRGRTFPCTVADHPGGEHPRVQWPTTQGENIPVLQWPTTQRENIPVRLPLPKHPNICSPKPGLGLMVALYQPSELRPGLVYRWWWPGVQLEMAWTGVQLEMAWTGVQVVVAWTGVQVVVAAWCSVRDGLDWCTGSGGLDWWWWPGLVYRWWWRPGVQLEMAWTGVQVAVAWTGVQVVVAWCSVRDGLDWWWWPGVQLEMAWTGVQVVVAWCSVRDGLDWCTVGGGLDWCTGGGLVHRRANQPNRRFHGRFRKGVALWRFTLDLLVKEIFQVEGSASKARQINNKAPVLRK